jgi:hypothetical protein
MCGCIEVSSSSLRWFVQKWPNFFASPVKRRVAGSQRIEDFGRIDLGACSSRIIVYHRGAHPATISDTHRAKGPAMCTRTRFDGAATPS